MNNERKVISIAISILLILFIGSWWKVNYTMRSQEYSWSNKDLILKLGDTELVKELIHNKAGPISDITWINGVSYFTYENNPIVKLNEIETAEAREVIFSNNSYTLSYYSLSFLRNYLLEHGLVGLDLNIIDSIIENIISDTKNYFWYNRYTVSDQSVSERLETLILYNSLKLEKGITPKTHHLNHIKSLISLLQNDSFFTYSMNHGLMQIRSLLRVGILASDEFIIREAIEKIKDIKGIYYGTDGAIMESATGYQVAIINFFYEFHELLIKVGNRGLEHDLNKMIIYLKSIIAEDYFLQGIGDSESFQILNNEKFKDVLFDSLKESEKLDVFKFSNRISGVSSSDSNFSLIFASLDNKPNVHKLPEDLSIYIYNGLPIFMNTGRYSYEAGDEIRQKFLDPKYQNGPKFLDNSYLYKSDITDVNVLSDSIISMLGYGVNNNDSIFRKVSVIPNEGVIRIKDFGTKPIYSHYILNPEINIFKKDEKTLILKKGDSIRFKLESNKNIEVSETPVSYFYKEKIMTKNLIIKGDNELIITIPNLKVTPFSLDNIKTYPSDIHRKKLIKELNKKYSRSLNLIKVKRTYTIIMIGIIFNLLMLSLKSYRRFAFSLLIFVIIALGINLFYNGRLVIDIFYNYIIPML